MDYKQIQDLIKLVNRSKLAELSIEQKDFKLKLRTVDGVSARGSSGTTTHVVAPMSTAPLQATPLPTAPAAAPAPLETGADDAGASADAASDEGMITVKAPMVGTFYRSSSPEADPFVKVGDSVSEGQVICIIEAMKLFNEIEAEVSGKVVKVLADDSSPVEYDQPLLIIDPKG